MKSIRIIILSFLSLLMLGSCSESNVRVAAGSPYTLTGSLWQDSATVDSVITLIIDRHESYVTLSGDTLLEHEEIELPVVEGHFSYQGKAPLDADELYLYDQHQHLIHAYGTSGAKLNFQMDSKGEVAISGIDTTDLVRVLMLRDSIPFISDSIRVRRLLGGFPESAKPEWLMNSINDILDQKSQHLSRNYRLPRIMLELPDTTYVLPHNQPESIVLLFWSDQDSASMDSLKMFNSIARDYALYKYADAGKFQKEKSATKSKFAHRIALFSLCTHASDSASWRSRTSDIAGSHCILPGGLAHIIATSCQVEELPWIVVLDRFGNYQTHNVWGKELYQWLEKSPLNSDLNKQLNK